MTSPDIAFTIVVVSIVLGFVAVRITRIITGNWDRMS